MTFHILGMSSSQLTFTFFRGVGIPPTRFFSLGNVMMDQLRMVVVSIFGRSHRNTGAGCFDPTTFQQDAAELRRILAGWNWISLCLIDLMIYTWTSWFVIFQRAMSDCRGGKVAAEKKWDFLEINMPLGDGWVKILARSHPWVRDTWILQAFDCQWVRLQLRATRPTFIIFMFIAAQGSHEDLNIGEPMLFSVAMAR
jgi:hypothetical protein